MKNTHTLDSRNKATARALRLVELLAGRFFDGVSNRDLAKALNTSPANITRDMQFLESQGWAKKLDNGNWSLTAKPISIMWAYTQHFEEMQSRIAESLQNIQATARRMA